MKALYLNLLFFLTLGSHSINAGAFETIDKTYEELHNKVKRSLGGGFEEFITLRDKVVTRLKSAGTFYPKSRNVYFKIKATEGCPEQDTDIFSHHIIADGFQAETSLQLLDDYFSSPAAWIIPDKDKFLTRPSKAMTLEHPAFARLKKRKSDLETLNILEIKEDIKELLGHYEDFAKVLCEVDPEIREELVDQKVRVDNPYGSFFITNKQALTILGINEYGAKYGRTHGGGHHVVAINDSFFKNDATLSAGPIGPGYETSIFCLHSVLLNPKDINPAMPFSLRGVALFTSDNRSLKHYIEELAAVHEADTSSFTKTFKDLEIGGLDISKFRFTNHDFIVQASARVGKEGFNDFLLREGAMLSAIDEESYSRHYIMNLITTPTDYKHDNYRIDETEERKVQIIGIDNDRNFEIPIKKAPGGFFINIKSTLFLLYSLANNKIGPLTRAHLANLNPELVVLQWLHALNRQNIRLGSINLTDPKKEWGTTKNISNAFHIPIKTSYFYIQQLLQKLKLIKDKCSLEDPLTHKELMKAFYATDIPLIHTLFNKLNETYSNPEKLLAYLKSLSSIKSLLMLDTRKPIKDDPSIDLAINDSFTAFKENKITASEALDQITTILKIDKEILKALLLLTRSQYIHEILERPLTEEEKVELEKYIATQKETPPYEAILSFIQEEVEEILKRSLAKEEIEQIKKKIESLKTTKKLKEDIPEMIQECVDELTEGSIEEYEKKLEEAKKDDKRTKEAIKALDRKLHQKKDEKFKRRSKEAEEKEQLRRHAERLNPGKLPSEVIQLYIKDLDISPSKSSHLWIKKGGTTLPVIELLEFMVTHYLEELKTYMHKSWESPEVLYGLLAHKAPIKIIKVLLEKAPTLVNHRDATGRTILHKVLEGWCDTGWDQEILDLLLKQPSQDLEAMASNHLTALDIAAENNLIKSFIQLREKGAGKQFIPHIMLKFYKHLCGLPSVEASGVATTLTPTSSVAAAGAGRAPPLVTADRFSISDEDIKKAKTAIKQLEEKNKDFQFRMAIEHILPEASPSLLSKAKIAGDEKKPLLPGHTGISLATSSIYTVEGVESGKRHLPPVILKQLFEPGTRHINRMNREGRGTVAIASSDEGYTLHFKFLPELPGREAAVSDLHHRVIGHGTSKSELFRWNEEIEIPIVSSDTKPKWGAGAVAKEVSYKYVKMKNVPVLVSLHVEGELLKDKLNKEESKGKGVGVRAILDGKAIESIEKELDPESLSDMILMAMLINPEDGKSDNYVFEPFIKADGKVSYRLACIDNDHAFVPVVTAAGKEHFRIQARSILFALDHMKEPIHPKTIEKFMALKVGETLSQWLSKLSLLASNYEKLYEGHSVEAYGFLKDYHSFIGIPFASGTIAHLYNKFIALQEALHKHPEYSHLDLLMKVEPALNTRYIKPLFDLPSPKERFEKVEGDAATKTLTRPLALLEAHGLVTTEALFQKILANDQVGPQKALEELKAAEEELKEKDKAFTKGLEHFKTLKTRKTIEAVLESTDFTSMTFHQKQSYLEALQQNKIPLHHLHIKGNQALTVQALEKMSEAQLKSLKHLTLDGCDNITRHLFPFLAARCEALKIIEIRNCTYHLSAVEEWESDLGVFGRTAGIYKSKPVTLEHVEHLELSNCSKLERIYLNAPKLKYLYLNGATALKEFHLQAPLLQRLEMPNSIQLKEDKLETNLPSLKHLIINKEGISELMRLLLNDPTLTAYDNNRLLQKKHAIGRESAKALAEALKINRTVQSIDLFINEIRDEGAKALAEVLKDNRTIQSIDLRSNEIGDEGAKALAEVLKINKTLQTIDLRDNKIGPEGAQKLVEALKNNTTIQKFGIDTEIYEQRGRILKYLDRNQEIAIEEEANLLRLCLSILVDPDASVNVVINEESTADISSSTTSSTSTSPISIPAAISVEEVRCGAGRPEDTLTKVIIRK